MIKIIKILILISLVILLISFTSFSKPKVAFLFKSIPSESINQISSILKEKRYYYEIKDNNTSIIIKESQKDEIMKFLEFKNKIIFRNNLDIDLLKNIYLKIDGIKNVEIITITKDLNKNINDEVLIETVLIKLNTNNKFYKPVINNLIDLAYYNFELKVPLDHIIFYDNNNNILLRDLSQSTQSPALIYDENLKE
jgi:hypothetical protein